MTEDIEEVAAPARCWLEAFPWIEAMAEGSQGNREESVDGSGSWWDEPIDLPGSDQRQERLGQLSDLVLGRLSRWTIGQVFPVLDAGLALADLSLTTRTRNALERHGFQKAGDLQGIEVTEILDWANVGVGTIRSLLHALADASTESAAPVVMMTPVRTRGRHRLPVEGDNQGQSRDQGVLRDLQMVGSWYAAVGAADAPMLGEELAVGTPAEIVAARRRLDQLSARGVFDHDRADLDIAEMLQQSISSLSERAQEVLTRRFFADDPETLNEIGASMGLSGGRVCQIEAAARANMVEFLKPGDTLLEPLSALGLVGVAVQVAVGTVLPLGTLIEQFPALARMVKAAGQPAWRVLDRLDDVYEIEDGWCATPTVEAAQSLTQARLQEVCDDHGVVRVEDIGALSPGRSAEDEASFLHAWLEYCGYPLDGDFVLTHTRSLGDWAASVLSIIGSPMSSEEILGRMQVERSLSSLKSALSGDERFSRVDRDRWALALWGMDSYTGVRALVHQEVACGGGLVGLKELVERITGQYSVSASSVVAYASSPPFRTKGGMVSMDTGGRDVRKTPQRTRRLYRRGSAWLYRVEITKDHLRGSGFPAPIAVAGVVGLQFGQTRFLESPHGQQSVNWTANQPSFGSIQRFLLDGDVGIGAEVFLILDDGGGFGVFGVEAVPEVTGDSLTDALSLVAAGGEGEFGDPRTRLAAAIGLPEASPWSSIIGGYRDRGDTDVADLLIAAKADLNSWPIARVTPTTDVEDILDLL